MLQRFALVPAVVLMTGTLSMTPAPAVSGPTGRAERIIAAAQTCPSWCTFCHAMNNDMWSYPSEFPNNDGYFGCSAGACEWGNCPETEEQMTAEEFGTAIVIATEGSPAEISEILDQHPRRVVLNEQRSAIQIKGCRGEIIAHIPVDPSRLAGLLDIEYGTR